MLVRRATPQDLRRIASLLESLGRAPLPELPLANVLVALEGTELIGVIALEVVALRGFMRAAAVEPSHAEQGAASSLLQTLLARANELSLRELYTVGANSESLLTRAGFVPISDDEVPFEISSTRAYREPRAEAAGPMRLELATRYV